MPPLPTPPTGPASAMPPPPPGGPAPGQSPIGSSPASMPSPNRGMETVGLAQLGLVVQLLTEKVLPALGATSEAGKDVLSILPRLAKHIPPGAMPSGIGISAMQGLLQNQKQMAPQIAAMRSAMGGAGGGAPGAPPAGGPPPGMPPS